MSIWRWLPTLLGFPLGGLVAMAFFGDSSSPMVATFGGLIVGAALGGAQWIALRPRVGPSWLVVTALGMALGGCTSWLLVGPPTSAATGAITGVLTGGLVGAGQAFVLDCGTSAGATWSASTGLLWALGWLIPATVIVDIDRAPFVFGWSGAAVVTLVSGIVLRMLIGRREPRRRPVAVPVPDEE